jgi:virginiamycin B lyase
MKIRDLKPGWLWLSVSLSVLVAAATGIWWTFLPLPALYESRPAGVRSLTMYLPEFAMAPEGVVPLKDGVFYYEHAMGPRAGFVSDAGALRAQDVRTKDQFESVALGADGTLWATSILDDHSRTQEWHGAIERIGPVGSRIVFRIPDRLGYAKQLLLGPDAAWWFALPDAQSVGRLSHDGHFTTVAHFGSMKPDQIAFDSTGTLYATERYGNRVAKVLPGGKVVAFLVPTRGGQVGALAGGANRDIWFTERAANRIGHITSTGSVEDFTTGPGVVVLDALAVSRDSVWFAVKDGIGRLSLRTHARTVIPLPYEVSWPNALAISRTGTVWFTESISNGRCMSECGGIGRIVP